MTEYCLSMNVFLSLHNLFSLLARTVSYNHDIPHSSFHSYSLFYYFLIYRINNNDSKKEEFRKYLEKTGVIDALTKVLVGLYEEPERPPNAVDYIKRYIGAPQNVDVESLKRENEQLKAQMDKLSKQMEEFKRA